MGVGELVRIVDLRRPRHVDTPILVVEDNPHLRGMLVQLPEEEGYPVLAVADGLEAIRSLQVSRPSLVVLDLNVPYVNGDEVGTRLRVRYGQNLPIILVTANQRGAEIAKALEAEYLPKPLNVDALLTVVWRCLGQV
jgi:CheY-like chemotaxis protein